MFSVNRVVAFLTPVFAAGAAVGSAWLVKHFPGVPVPSQGQILGVEIAGAASAAAAALKWLHGHQLWEARIHQAELLVKHVENVVTKIDPQLTAELEQLVKTQIAGALSNVTLAGIPAAPAAADAPAAVA
jgi:hypothetical protein